MDSGWNHSSDPCEAKWTGIVCHDENLSVKSITFDSFNLSGTFNPSFICNIASLATSIVVISIKNNNLHADNLESIANCNQLTHLYVSGNRFVGNLPEAFSRLNNLKRLEISDNGFSGDLPSLSRISGLIEFLAQNNRFSGSIPEFDFSNLANFNVSNNNFSGKVPPGMLDYVATHCQTSVEFWETNTHLRLKPRMIRKRRGQIGLKS